MIRRLMYPEWCYVVRSDRRVVTVPRVGRLERWAHAMLWEVGIVAVASIWGHLRALTEEPT